MATYYAPLLLRSNYSLLSGTCSIERIIERAADFALPSVALTDRNNLYGAIPFYNLAREAGIKPVIGAEITSGRHRAVLLARDLAGYSNLCKIITRRNLQEGFSLPDCLVEFQEGLYILTEDPVLAEKLRARVNREHLRLLLAWPGRSHAQWRLLCRRAQELGLAVAATPDVYFMDRREYELHRVLAAIGENTLVSKLEPQDVAHHQSCFVPPKTVARMFREYPGALRNGLEVLEDCNLEIPLGRPIFPRYSLPEGETPHGYLSKLCLGGLRRRYHPVTAGASSRLKRELEVIEKLGFTEYFIFVWDIMSFARRQGIPTTGRGSGASSMVSYVLGITQADPIKYDIPFERFLHMQRADCPDLDIDLCWIKRDDLIESIYEKYGASRVAMVSTHNAFRLRSAFREVAKAFGIPNDLVNKMSRKLPHDSTSTIREAVAMSGADQFVTAGEQVLNTVVELAERIRGYPRHLGIHCGGLVIGDKPVDNYVPLERAAKGIVITQYEKDAIEEIGLVKMDFLGNHGLTIREEAIELVREHRGVQVKAEAIPDPDPETSALLKGARTISCCQLESPAMRNLLTMLQVSSTKELMQALALIRPAPASCGMKEAFVRRKRGLEQAVFPHPSLRTVLADTYGIMLYEDDAMLVAAALGGISLEEGDLLRRAISRGASQEKLEEISKYFIGKAARNGIPLQVAREMWAQMAKFNSYSFCKAHAASYAILAYQLAYLKAHYPLEFMVAALNHQWGMYPKRVHLEEARRLGLEVLGPCVNRSRAEFTIEGGKIRIGLNQVRNLSQSSIDHILAARRGEPFGSLGDFLGRVKISEPEVENLILGGAFDFTGRIRPQLILELKTTYPARKRHAAKGRLISGDPAAPRPPELSDYSPAQKLAYELSVLELSPRGHPMKILRSSLEGNGMVDSEALPRMVGKCVRVAGVLAAVRKSPTKNDDYMEFVTLEDEKGVFEVTLFPGVYRKFGRCIDGIGPYVVEGTVEDRYGSLSVNARKVAPFAPVQSP